jgi:hypothetical protein
MGKKGSKRKVLAGHWHFAKLYHPQEAWNLASVGSS